MAMAAAVFDRPFAHDGDRLPSQNELSYVYVDLVHSRKDNIIALSRVDDQELSIAAVRTGECHPTVAGRDDDRFDAGRDQHSFPGAAEPIGLPKPR